LKGERAPDRDPGLQIEMYADTGARGGVLEPEIKFRAADLVATMHRLDPIILKLKAEGDVGSEGAIKKRESELLPIYRQVRHP
jgi:acetyl-CoA carboxylase/biotin carboxylase 1